MTISVENSQLSEPTALATFHPWSRLPTEIQYHIIRLVVEISTLTAQQTRRWPNASFALRQQMHERIRLRPLVATGNRHLADVANRAFYSDTEIIFANNKTTFYTAGQINFRHPSLSNADMILSICLKLHNMPIMTGITVEDLVVPECVGSRWLLAPNPEVKLRVFQRHSFYGSDKLSISQNIEHGLLSERNTKWQTLLRNVQNFRIQIELAHRQECDLDAVQAFKTAIAKTHIILKTRNLEVEILPKSGDDIIIDCHCKHVVKRIIESMVGLK